jgi:hypothetical protein
LQAPGQGRTQRANSVWIPAQQFQIEPEIAMVPGFKEKNGLVEPPANSVSAPVQKSP